MRIKAVLRDSDILDMESGSIERINKVTEKNLDRVVSWTSLLKIMGLQFDERTKMLEVLEGKNIHIWLGIQGEQHIIYLSKKPNHKIHDLQGYQWQ